MEPIYTVPALLIVFAAILFRLVRFERYAAVALDGNRGTSPRRNLDDTTVFSQRPRDRFTDTATLNAVREPADTFGVYHEIGSGDEPLELEYFPLSEREIITQPDIEVAMPPNASR